MRYTLQPTGTRVANDAAGDGSRALPDAVMGVKVLSIGFGATTVMSDITVGFPRNSVTALVGASGSGKTTFLRSLNRMNDKVRGFWRKGSIFLDDTEIHGRDVDPLLLRRRVGMVFQRPNPFPMSIQDNVVAGVRAHRMARRSQLRDVAETCLAEVGLWSAVADRLSDSPFRLSGGQQQLLCLARALAIEPEVLLLDEPTSSLDPRSTEAVEELVRRLRPKLTVIIVTHNLAQARRISDQMVYFSEGRLVEHGVTQELFERPRRPETARYLLGEAGVLQAR